MMIENDFVYLIGGPWDNVKIPSNKIKNKGDVIKLIKLPSSLGFGETISQEFQMYRLVDARNLIHTGGTGYIYIAE